MLPKNAPQSSASAIWIHRPMRSAMGESAGVSDATEASTRRDTSSGWSTVEPQRDPAAAGLGLDREGRLRPAVGGQPVDRRGHRIGDDAWVHQVLDLRRIVGQRPSDHHHRPRRGAAFPSAQEDLLGACQLPQAGLDATQHQQRRARWRSRRRAAGTPRFARRGSGSRACLSPPPCGALWTASIGP